MLNGLLKLNFLVKVWVPRVGLILVDSYFSFAFSQNIVKDSGFTIFNNDITLFKALGLKSSYELLNLRVL